MFVPQTKTGPNLVVVSLSPFLVSGLELAYSFFIYNFKLSLSIVFSIITALSGWPICAEYSYEHVYSSFFLTSSQLTFSI